MAWKIRQKFEVFVVGLEQNLESSNKHRADVYSGVYTK